MVGKESRKRERERGGGGGGIKDQIKKDQFLGILRRMIGS